jgi:hypothetical protein
MEHLEDDGSIRGSRARTYVVNHNTLGHLEGTMEGEDNRHASTVPGGALVSLTVLAISSQH